MVHMYYTYVIKSQSLDIFYIGQTNNLTDRVNRHNQNRNKYTKGKGPWELIFSKGFVTRAEAVRLEMKLKSFRNKAFLEKWIYENTISSAGLEHPDASGGSQGSNPISPT